MVIEFRPGLILNAILENSNLIIKNLCELPTDLLERFNELFADSHCLTLIEDIVNTITSENQKILKDFNCRIFGTGSKDSLGKLSEAIISRFSIIFVGKYQNKEEFTVLKSYVDKNSLFNIEEDDINYLIDSSKRLNESFVGINITLFQIMNILGIIHNIKNKFLQNSKYSKITNREISTITLYYIGRGYIEKREQNNIEKLCEALEMEQINESLMEKNKPMFLEDYENQQKGIRSKITNLFMPTESEINNGKIAFTRGFNEISEIVYFGIVNNYPVILEGPPGQGKLTCIKYIAEYLLGYNIEIINISKNTKVEDLLGKEIIVRKDDNSIEIRMNETKLMKALKKLENKENSNDLFYQNKILFVFNNINNANPSVMELLSSIFDKNQTEILSYDGNTFKKKNIQIIGIFNPQNGDSKEKLSNSLIYSSLYHVVIEPDDDSIKAIISKKLEKEPFKEDMIILYKAYKEVKYLLEYTYQKENSINLNDITKYISFRKISYGKIEDISIILSLIFVYRFPEEKIIKEIQDILNITSMNIKPSIIYDVPPGTLTYKIGEKNLISIKTFKNFTEDEKEILKNKFISLTSHQKICILFLILCKLSKQTPIIQGETASGKTHVINIFAELIGKSLNEKEKKDILNNDKIDEKEKERQIVKNSLITYQITIETGTSIFIGQSKLNYKITKKEYEILTKIFEELKSFKQLENIIENEFMNNYEDWKAESFEKLIIEIKKIEMLLYEDDPLKN